MGFGEHRDPQQHMRMVILGDPMGATLALARARVTGAQEHLDLGQRLGGAGGLVGGIVQIGLRHRELSSMAAREHASAQASRPGAAAGQERVAAPPLRDW